MNNRERRHARQKARKIAEMSKDCVRCEKPFYDEDRSRKICQDCRMAEEMKAEQKQVESDERWAAENDPEKKHWENMATYNERHSDNGSDY